MSIGRINFRTADAAIKYILQRPQLIVCWMCHESAFTSNTWEYEQSTHTVKHQCVTDISYSAMISLRKQESSRITNHNSLTKVEMQAIRDKEPGGCIICSAFNISIRHKRYDSCCVIL